jgi:hypothetical protein
VILSPHVEREMLEMYPQFNIRENKEMLEMYPQFNTRENKFNTRENKLEKIMIYKN